jgi:lipid-A-disaccharide synthase-like uncharacterized protein
LTLTALQAWWGHASVTEIVWLAVGFAAQMMFAMRFLVQWVHTERARRSVMPDSFWYFSLAGGVMLLTYAIYRLDPVFILGQAMGLVVYIRNLYFIRLHRRTLKQAAPAE